LHAFSFVFVLFKWNIIHLNSSRVFFKCFFPSWIMSLCVNASSLYKHGLSFIAVEFVCYKKCALVYHLCLSTGVFVVKKRSFLCVAYGQYPNIFFNFL
jgi:hypothetical protein